MNQPLRFAPPGREFAINGLGQLVEVDARNTADVGWQAPHGFMGEHPQDRGGIEHSPEFADFTKIPAIYPVSIILEGTDGATKGESVPLRPEQFVLKRITWATTGDTPKFIAPSASGGSSQGRVVEVEWQDEFTKFLGTRKGLISALFGDSQGFLDIPRGALFQGKQSLSITLTRITWPDTTTAQTTRFDFVFHGLSLLPKGVHQSGSAG